MPDAIVLVGAALAGFVQGLSGFAFALVATVFWSGHLSPQEAAPLVAFASVIGQLQSIRTVLPSVDLRRCAPMVAGGVLGVPLGVWLLTRVDPDAFRLGVGLLLCVYCPAMLMLGRLPRVQWGGRGADAAAGALGGVMGGIAGLAGPAPILWCALRAWDRDAQRAVFQSVLIAIQLVAMATYAAVGLVTPRVLHLALWVTPCALLPSLAGTALYGRIPPGGFRVLVLLLLLLTGVTLLVEAALRATAT